MITQRLSQAAEVRIRAYCRTRGIRSLALFGSRLRGDATLDSDTDLLVEFESGRRISLFDLAQMELDLAEIIGTKVDLRTPADLSPYFRDSVLSEAVPIYAAR